MGFFERLKEGLSKTRRNFTDRIQELVGLSAAIDDDFLDELEMILLSADVGVKTTEKLIDAVRKAAKKKEISGTEDVIPFLKKYMAEMLADSGQRTRIGAKPTVILVVGVNGVGKTTTIGKLANYFTLFKYKVVLAAGDTFRAAAGEQLQIWGERAHCDVIRHAEGADPAAVVFDAMKAAIARKADILFIDTAGRLHNKANLMNELEKIHRIIKREIPELRTKPSWFWMLLLVRTQSIRLRCLWKPPRLPALYSQSWTALLRAVWLWQLRKSWDCQLMDWRRRRHYGLPPL